ncbi:MAG: hypothetical protein KGZ83_10545 [Sulfuricella sp.]|nr:hypothetical protein [Sulfuricella sp.]
MNTNAISSSYTGVLAQSSVTGVQRVNSRDSDGDKDGDKGRTGRSGGGQGVLNAVTQTLGQLGINVPAQPAGKPAATPASGASSTLGQASSTSDAKQALHTFMNDLFQATKQSTSSSTAEQNPNSSVATTPSKSYGGLAPKLQGLMQQLNSGSSSDVLNKLQASFDNLVKTQGNASSSSSTTASSATPKLQDFLQKLSQNLAGGGISPVGSLVSTVA